MKELYKYCEIARPSRFPVDAATWTVGDVTKFHEIPKIPGLKIPGQTFFQKFRDRHWQKFRDRHCLKTPAITFCLLSQRDSAWGGEFSPLCSRQVPVFHDSGTPSRNPGTTTPGSGPVYLRW
jgi:hypothetical protein